MRRFLSAITPGRGATLLGTVLAVLAFLLGLLETLTRNHALARYYLYLSIGVPASILFLKYLSVHATFSMAEDAHRKLRRQVANRARPAAGPNGAAEPQQESEAEVRAREKAEMVHLVSDLRQALEKIQPESPARPKYEATIELIERVMRRAGN